jgi:hypothetical protein
MHSFEIEKVGLCLAGFGSRCQQFESDAQANQC